MHHGTGDGPAHGALAVGDGARVDACGCGGVKVTVGPMSAHFSASSFLELARVVTLAARRLTADGTRDLGARSTETH
ncbi:MAG: hypothetical protein H6704_10155 [Myxococcales bacterium]|nr:hypothetical protein [Myxococcales bacterium]